MKRGDAKQAMPGGDEAFLRQLLLPVPGTRLDGSLLRRRRLASRQPHDLDGLAIHASLPQRLLRELQPAAREGAADLPRRLRLLRAERARGRLRRRRHSVAGGRQPGARAVDASGRARLGSQGPPQPVELRAATDAQGNIVAWEAETWIPMWISAKGTIPLVGLDAAGIKQRQGRWPGSLDENLDPPYTSPNASVVIHRLKDSPLRPGHVRAPGKVANCWAVESLVDEIAASAGEDAVAYRLKRLTDPRAVAVVKRAAEMLDWQPRPVAESESRRQRQTHRPRLLLRPLSRQRELPRDGDAGDGRSRHGQSRGRSRGLRARLRPRRQSRCAEEPDRGLDYPVLEQDAPEEVKFDRSRVTSVDWAGYPVIRFPEVPPIEIALIDRPDQPLMGAGEASLAPVGGRPGECDLRRHGQAPPHVPIHAFAGESLCWR